MNNKKLVPVNGTTRLFGQANEQLSKCKSELARLTHSGYLAKEERRKIADLKYKIKSLEQFVGQCSDIPDTNTEHNVHDTQDTTEKNIFTCLTDEQND